MGAHAPIDLSKVDPWADPSPAQSGYWMALLGLFVAFSIFAGTYLVYEWQNMGEAVGSKAPSEQSPAKQLNQAHDDELTRAVQGDKLILKGGRTIDAGKVVEVEEITDWEAKPPTRAKFIYVVGPHYLMSGDAKQTMVRLGDEELRFTPDQVQSIQKGAGKTLAVPLSQGMQRYVESYRKKHGR